MSEQIQFRSAEATDQELDPNTLPNTLQGTLNAINVYLEENVTQEVTALHLGSWLMDHTGNGTSESGLIGRLKKLRAEGFIKMSGHGKITKVHKYKLPTLKDITKEIEEK